MMARLVCGATISVARYRHRFEAATLLDANGRATQNRLHAALDDKGCEAVSHSLKLNPALGLCSRHDTERTPSV